MPLLEYEEFDINKKQAAYFTKIFFVTLFKEVNKNK